MRMEDMILISADDHVVEPTNMWEGPIPQKYLEYAAKIVMQNDGTEAWKHQHALVLLQANNVGVDTGFHHVEKRSISPATARTLRELAGRTHSTGR